MMRDRKKTGVIGVEVYVLDIKEETGRTYIKGKATIQAQYRGNVGVTTATTTVLVEYAKMGTVKSLGLKKGDKIKKGDILAVLATGAYNYSMASNYNRLPKPPVIMIKDGVDYIAVKRETYEHITANDI